MIDVKEDEVYLNMRMSNSDTKNQQEKNHKEKKTLEG
jgi:hypothetical protein